MATDPIGEAATYHGSSGQPPVEPKPRRPPGRNLILGGVAGAVALGLVFGLVSRPQFAEPADRRPMQPVTPVPVEVLAPPPLPAPQAVGRLEVLPPDMARRANAEPVVVARAPLATDSDEFVIPEPAARPVARPSFDCADARSRSEAMVCDDPQLAAADRRLDRAYARAIDAGVPARMLRAEQDDWLEIREDAARRSPDAVASIYEQRTRELDDLAARNAYGPDDEID
jgi:uncharacterized protein YecT (DUF1311 family)